MSQTTCTNQAVVRRPGGEDFHRLVCLTLTMFVIALLILGLASAAFSRTYYVAKTGRDTNPGSLQRPFLTINRAAQRTRAGDTVFVRGGIYQERVAPRYSGIKGSPITYRNYSNEQVTVDAVGQQQGFILWKVSYIHIIGFTVTNSTRSGIHIHHHLDNTDAGSDNNVIEHNVIQRAGTEGFNGIFVGGNGNRILNNIVTENGRVNPEPSGHGIYVSGAGNTIAHNRIHANARMGIRMEGAEHSIADNTIENNGEYGMTIWVDAPWHATDITIERNLLINNARGGMRIFGEGSGTKPEHITLYHNTVVNSEAAEGIAVTGGSQAVTIKNNIVTGHFTRAILKVDDLSAQEFEEDYNIYFGAGPFVYRSVSFTGIEGYRVASGWGAHSLSQDPLLNAQYAPSPGSIAIDRGIDIGLPFSGVAPDIGYIETGGNSRLKAED